MSLSFFTDSNESAGNGELKFASDYVKENPKENGKHFTINEIKLVKSGKGYMLITEYFACWIWKRSKIATQLIEALDQWVKEGTGYVLIAVLDSKSKDKFQLAANFELPCYWYDLGNGCYGLTDQSSTNTTNPFLPVANSLLSDPPLTEKGEGQQRKTKKQPLEQP